MDPEQEIKILKRILAATKAGIKAYERGETEKVASLKAEIDRLVLELNQAETKDRGEAIT